MDFKPLIFLTVLIFASFIKKAQAYPQFIAHGYNSCLTCHYNPFGGGPLNDYGRALSATLVSSSALYPQKFSDEDIADLSGAFLSQPKQKYFRPSADYRGLLLKRNFQEQSETNQYIDMQIDVNGVLKLGSEDQYYASATFGYAPQPLSKTGQAREKKYRTREHIIGARFMKNHGIYVGLTDKVYGIRIPDHVYYSRSINNLSQNDQTHGAFYHYTNNVYDIGLHYFIGNLVQTENVRQKGFSGKFEYTLNNNLRLGFSLISSSSEVAKQESKAIHIKKGFYKKHSLLSEIGTVKFSSKLGGSDTEYIYGLGQSFFSLVKGLYLTNTVEYLKTKDANTYTINVTPGLQYFPIQRMELRFDFQNSRNFSDSTSTNDSWNFLGQVHVYL
jgi:hypothetical protein